MSCKVSSFVYHDRERGGIVVHIPGFIRLDRYLRDVRIHQKSRDLQCRDGVSIIDQIRLEDRHQIFDEFVGPFILLLVAGLSLDKVD